MICENTYFTNKYTETKHINRYAKLLQTNGMTVDTRSDLCIYIYIYIYIYIHIYTRSHTHTHTHI